METILTSRCQNIRYSFTSNYLKLFETWEKKIKPNFNFCLILYIHKIIIKNNNYLNMINISIGNSTVFFVCLFNFSPNKHGPSYPNHRLETHGVPAHPGCPFYFPNPTVWLLLQTCPQYRPFVQRSLEPSTATCRMASVETAAEHERILREIESTDTNCIGPTLRWVSLRRLRACQPRWKMVQRSASLGSWERLQNFKHICFLYRTANRLTLASMKYR